jgi:hypothetical protein
MHDEQTSDFKVNFGRKFDFGCEEDGVSYKRRNHLEHDTVIPNSLVRMWWPGTRSCEELIQASDEKGHSLTWVAIAQCLEKEEEKLEFYSIELLGRNYRLKTDLEIREDRTQD